MDDTELQCFKISWYGSLDRIVFGFCMVLLVEIGLTVTTLINDAAEGNLRSK